MTADTQYVSLLYHKGVIREDWITEIVKNLVKVLGPDLDEFGYSWIDKRETSWKIKSRSGKYSTKRWNSFIDFLHDSNDLDVTITIEKYSSGYEYKSRDFEFCMMCKQHTRYSSIVFILSDSFIKKLEIKETTIHTCDIVMRYGVKPYYGLSFNMNKYKDPGVFVGGIHTENLTEQEHVLVNILNDNLNHLDEVIWDISWGNIINRKHFIDEHTVDYLKKELGEENVVSLGEDLVWFNLEGDIRDFDKHKSKTRAKLLKYFEPKMARLKE